MGNDEHLSEETLNAYLDGELGAREHGQVDIHLETCTMCLAELQTLQELFVALEELETNPAPTFDLTPGVLARIRPRRRDLRLRWFVPALQSVAALALLAWGWTRLANYWTATVNAVPMETVIGTWSRAAEWGIAQWAKLNALPNATWSSLQSWIIHPTLSRSPGLSPPQLAVTGIILAALWLACNIMLLRRSPINRHKTQS
jgi:anti-sigma factor RsiW